MSAPGWTPGPRGRRVLVRSGLIVLIAVCWLAPPARAAVVETTQTEAERLLERVASAVDVPYRARQLVAYFGEPQSNALLDVSSSADGRFVKAESGSGVTRIWSRTDVGVLAGDDVNLQEVAQPTVRLSPSDILAKYSVELGTSQEQLGTRVIPLAFVRRRDGTTVERWLVHERSGVVYRRTLYDTAGEVVGMSTVIEMEWGDPGPADPVERDLDDAKPVRSIAAPDAPATLAGGYRLWQAYALELGGRSCEQWVYSDGLHALSVFTTHGNLKHPDDFEAVEVDGARAWAGPGPGTWAWQGDGRSWLLVAEESALDAAEMIDPFPKGGPSVFARLGSVWSRLIRAIGGLFD